jgi:hypothetical protein
MMALRWTIDKSAMDQAGSQGLIQPMPDFHAVFPYPVSPNEASGTSALMGSAGHATIS